MSIYYWLNNQVLLPLIESGIYWNTSHCLISWFNPDEHHARRFPITVRRYSGMRKEVSF